MHFEKVKVVTSLDVIKKLGSEMYQDLIKTSQAYPPSRWYYNWATSGEWFMIRQNTNTLDLCRSITYIRDKDIYILSSLEAIKEEKETWPRSLSHWDSCYRGLSSSARRYRAYMDPIGDLIQKPETIDPDPNTMRAIKKTWGPDDFEELKNRINQEYEKYNKTKLNKNT